MKNLLIPILFALGTALCWGMYGPALGNARSTAKPPEWSPFKPYVFIGVAYLVIAIIGGLIAMKLKGDSFSYADAHAPAKNWGFIAGCLGAAGAFFLTNAVMSSKGNTALVMPIVFGGAVTVNGIFAFTQLKKLGYSPDPRLWVGMALVAAGVITVAIFTPHGPPKSSTPAGESSAAVDTDASANADTTGTGEQETPYTPPSNA